jgi:hypothetical protein
MAPFQQCGSGLDTWISIARMLLGGGKLCCDKVSELCVNLFLGRLEFGV